MFKKLWESPSVRSEQGLRIIRIVIALIMIIHPLHRTYNGNVTGFGEYLDSIGYPFGVAVAWLITITQIIGSLALIFGKFIVPFSILNIGIFLVGIVLVHYPDGWFVVGGGTNGMEFSFALIACLLGIVWAYWPQNSATSISK